MTPEDSKVSTPHLTDFTAHPHPALAVSCPTCQADVGTWCKWTSGAPGRLTHSHRKALTGLVFVEIYGDGASLTRTDGSTVINMPPRPKGLL